MTGLPIYCPRHDPRKNAVSFGFPRHPGPLSCRDGPHGILRAYGILSFHRLPQPSCLNMTTRLRMQDCWAKTDGNGLPCLSVRDHCLNVGAVAERTEEGLCDARNPPRRSYPKRTSDSFSERILLAVSGKISSAEAQTLGRLPCGVPRAMPTTRSVPGRLRASSRRMLSG